jgi:hypothetical protein
MSGVKGGDSVKPILFLAFVVWASLQGLGLAQAPFRPPSALMISLMNRMSQMSYAIGMSQWERLQEEVQGLVKDAESYAGILPRGTPLEEEMKAFRDHIAALERATRGRDPQAVGRWYGQLATDCLTCHKKIRDF